MADDLEARLQSHAKAFEGLMSLLPPDLYYGKQNTENEWMKKKQTKEEKKAARRAKLNPANHKTAADVANERDRKRTLEDEAAERAAAGLDGPIERPGEGMSRPKAKTQKTAKSHDVHSKTKKEESDTSKPIVQQNEGASEDAKEERRRAKEQRRKEKQARKTAKAEQKKASKRQAKTPAGPVTNENAEDEDDQDEDDDGDDESLADATSVQPDADIDTIDISGLVDEERHIARRSSSRSVSPDPEFSPYHDDRSSSTSTLPTPDDADQQNLTKSSKRKPSSKPVAQTPLADEQHETPEQAKARKDAQIAKLHALIEAKRKARNADGLDGKPARSRSELIEARRQKAQQLKEKKKTLRAQEREKLKKEEFEAHLASLRGSPALGSELFAPRSRSASVSSPGVANNSFAFGRVAFADGARLNAAGSAVETPRKTKGPSDAKTALLAAERHQAHLHSLDPAKRADLEEKDMWLHARQRIAGEKVRDDVNLLRKSVKRKEKARARSEKEWNERVEGVKKGVEARQKRREENLQKRKEEKGKKGGKKTGAGVKKKPAKKRAGFEGTFRGRA